MTEITEITEITNGQTFTNGTTSVKWEMLNDNNYTAKNLNTGDIKVFAVDTHVCLSKYAPKLTKRQKEVLELVNNSDDKGVSVHERIKIETTKDHKWGGVRYYEIFSHLVVLEAKGLITVNCDSHAAFKK